MRTSDLSPEEYNIYFKGYIDQVGDNPLMVALEKGLRKTQEFFRSIPKEKLEFRYAEGKWTLKEILLHLIDAERVFCYRALCFARAKDVDLKGFDENEFVPNSNANTRSLEDLLNEFSTVRKASISLFNSFSTETLKRVGRASGSSLSVRAAGFLICGHEKHHYQIITERYLY